MDALHHLVRLARPAGLPGQPICLCLGACWVPLEASGNWRFQEEGALSVCLSVPRVSKCLLREGRALCCQLLHSKVSRYSRGAAQWTPVNPPVLMWLSDSQEPH
jgi:hypothetical protein